MTQSSNRILDEFAKLMTDAAGAAQGVKREVETLMKSQGERVVRSMELVSREEFDAVKAMAEKARAENERLKHVWSRWKRGSAQPPPDNAPRRMRPFASRP